MFDINSKPKKISIQRKSKDGMWLTITEINARRRHFSYEEVKELMMAYRRIDDLNILDDEIKEYQVINEHKKTILNSRNLDFNEKLECSSMITVKYPNSDIINIYTKGENPEIENFRHFQRYISRHGGIKKWKSYPVEKKDNYLMCGRLTLRDDTNITVAFH